MSDLATTSPVAPMDASQSMGPMDRDWRRPLTILLTLLAGLALLWVGWQIITPVLRTLILFILAAILAFTLAPAVNILERRIGRRIVAIGVVYVFVGGLMVGGLVLLAGPFVAQATTLAGDLPRYVGALQDRLPEAEAALRTRGIDLSLSDLQGRVLASLDQNGVDVLTHLVGTLGEIGGVIVDVLLALIISFYLLLDGPVMRRRLFRLIPPEHQAKAAFFETNASRVLGGYLRGQLIMAVTIGVLAGGGAALLGLPYALVIGVLAGLFELIPMFGPILSAVPALLVALFQPFPTVIWVLVFFIAIQQVESNILGPRITGHAVGLHPLAAMFALLAGFQLAGVLGGLFAVPVAGIVWVLIAAAYRNVVTDAKPRHPARGLRWPRGRFTARDPRADSPAEVRS